MYIGHQRFRVSEDLRLNPCKKCAGTSHSAKKCTYGIKCLRCSGYHEVKDCRNKNMAKSPNCTYRNETFNLQLDTNHIATDTKKCTFSKYHINKKIISTDYSVEPRIPKFLGFSGVLKRELQIQTT